MAVLANEAAASGHTVEPGHAVAVGVTTGAETTLGELANVFSGVALETIPTPLRFGSGFGIVGVVEGAGFT